MNYLKKKYLNLIFLLLGIVLLAFGGSILVFSKQGADSLTVFSQGLAKFLKVNLGYGIIIANIIFLIFMLIFNRKRIGVGTVFTATLIGLLFNLFLDILPFKELDNYFINLLFSFSGLLVISLGLAIYIYSNTGLGAFEGFIDYFAELFKIKFGYIKIIIDGILFSLGVLMGGVFGITSIVSVIIVGPLIEFFKYLLNKTNLIKNDSSETIETSP